MTNNATIEQVKLEQRQIAEFHIDCFAETQLEHFSQLTGDHAPSHDGVVVDVGGGVGFFARALQARSGRKVRVIDSDPQSVGLCTAAGVEAKLGDALKPSFEGDEAIACFNLILHHLVGRNEAETRQLQKQALQAWASQVDFVYINEYIYDSYVGNVTGRLIYEITSSRFLSALGNVVGKVIPAFRANTFGVGVRFRAHDEWLALFDECGLEVVDKIYAEKDYTAPPLRLLLIDEVRLDSFLLRRRSALSGAN